MDIENQVVSLELAKKMKKLGFKQDSLWWWVERFRQDVPEQVPYYCVETKGIPYRDNRGSQNIICSAYTVAELGEMLGWAYRSGKTGVNTYMCNDNFGDKGIEADTEANARAKMLIWLKENKSL